jgi:glucoamylase
LDSGGSTEGIGAVPCELDVATLLGVLYSKALPGQGTDYPQAFNVYDPEVMQTLYALLKSFEGIYEVNDIDDAAGLPGMLIGRYPGDEYSGVIMSAGATSPCQGFSCGNPWFLATHAVAQVFYEVAEAVSRGDVSYENAEHMACFKKLAKYEGKEDDTAAIFLAVGDAMLVRSKHHRLPGMHMSEQIYRGNNKFPPLTPGQQMGVADLTLSYAALLDALEARVAAAKA